MNNLDEFIQRRSVLKDSEYVSYLYDEENLIITQLNVMTSDDNITLSEYINKYLSTYECSKIEEQ
jgi:hypothetical protein